MSPKAIGEAADAGKEIDSLTSVRFYSSCVLFRSDAEMTQAAPPHFANISIVPVFATPTAFSGSDVSSYN